jgi:hypothetical protein
MSDPFYSLMYGRERKIKCQGEPKEMGRDISTSRTLSKGENEYPL